MVHVLLFLWLYFCGTTRKRRNRSQKLQEMKLYQGCRCAFQQTGFVEPVQLREPTRPVSDTSSLTLYMHTPLLQVILAGNKETITLALKKAERFRTEFLSQGVFLVPVIWGEGKEPKIAKKGFVLSPKAAASLPCIGEEFYKRIKSIVSKSKLKAEIRFKAKVVSPVEWERWIRDQQKSEGTTPGEDVCIVLCLDGRVRKSERGMPEWQEIVKELPPMETFLIKTER